MGAHRETKLYARLFAVVLLAVALLAAGMPTSALAEGADSAEPELTAQAGNIASGICGTCPWTIDANRKLTISAGTLEDCQWDSAWPWQQYRAKITSIAFDGTVSCGENLCFMFYNCPKLTSVDLTGLDLSGVQSVQSMFAACSSLSAINLSGLDMSSVTNMTTMFNKCTKLASVNFDGVDTSNVTEMP